LDFGSLLQNHCQKKKIKVVIGNEVCFGSEV